MTLTEQQWNEVYNDIYGLLWKLCVEKGKTEEQCKEYMEEIKKIYTTEDESVLSY